MFGKSVPCYLLMNTFLEGMEIRIRFRVIVYILRQKGFSVEWKGER